MRVLKVRILISVTMLFILSVMSGIIPFPMRAEGQPLTPEEIDELIKQLGDDEWSVRVKATKKLIENGNQEKVREAVKSALKTTTDLEVKWRCEFILEHIEFRQKMVRELERFKKDLKDFKAWLIYAENWLEKLEDIQVIQAKGLAIIRRLWWLMREYKHDVNEIYPFIHYLAELFYELEKLINLDDKKGDLIKKIDMLIVKTCITYFDTVKDTDRDGDPDINEDTNRNGKYEREEGETDPGTPSTGPNGDGHTNPERNDKSDYWWEQMEEHYWWWIWKPQHICVPSPPVYKNITYDGGIFTDDVGTVVIVPPGAIENTTTLAIWTPVVPILTGITYPDYNALIAVSRVIAPFNITLLKPVTIKLSYMDEQIFGLDETRLQVFVFSPEMSTWIPISTLNIDTDTNTVIFESKFLAEFGIGAPLTTWPMFRHDLRHTGYPISPAPHTNQTLWTYTTGGQIFSSPAVANGIVVIGSDDANVYALNETTGALIWSYTTGAGVKSSAAIEYGLVFIGSEDSNIYALNATTGALVWNYATGNMISLSSPAVSNGIVYIGSYDGNVYALNVTTGALIWNYMTGQAIDSSPAVAYGILYVGSWDGYLYALNATDGTLVWKHLMGIGISSPTIDDGRVYMASDYSVFALNATTGEIIWVYVTGAYTASSPAIAYGTVFIGSGNENMYALNATTGALIWSYTTGGPIDSSPAVAGRKVFFGSEDNKVYALNATTGELIWSYTTTLEVFSSPAIGDGRLYMGCEDKVYAFSSLHDVAVIDVMLSKTVVGQGYSVGINVTVENQGDYTETFNLGVFCSLIPIDPLIETKEITLTSLNSTTFTFMWNTTGFAKGNYTISANAWPVLGETYTADNNCTDGRILVTKVGDLGGGLPPQFFECDGKVDGKDLALFLMCFKGISPLDAMYLGDLGSGVPPEFYQCDGKVDGKDLALFLLCFKGLGPDS